MQKHGKLERTLGFRIGIGGTDINTMLFVTYVDKEMVIDVWCISLNVYVE